MKSEVARADEARERGNVSMKNGRPTEAFFHYTEAIKVNPADFRALGNRSFAFLKMEQHYHALEDAKTAVGLQPDWPKGYYRRAEVEMAIGEHEAAIRSYEQAIALNSTDSKMREALEIAKKELQKKKSAEFRIPCVCVAIGVAIGLLLLLADHYLTSKPMELLVVKLSFLGFFALCGFGASTIYFFILQTYREALIQPPREQKGAEKERDQKQTNDIMNMFNVPHPAPGQNTAPAPASAPKQKGVRQRKSTGTT